MGNPVYHLTDEEKAYYGLDKNDITFKDARSFYVRSFYTGNNFQKADKFYIILQKYIFNQIECIFLTTAQTV